jgi:hypothetical protein
MNVKTFWGFSYSASKRGVEIVTSPYGDPPFGGAKMPRTRRCSILPEGASTWRGEPTARWWSLAKSLETKAPFRFSSAGTDGEPACQSTVITRLTFGATPDTLI